MSMSRLLGIMMELSRGPAASVGALAQRFDVSERTVQRDLLALRGLGVPIWTQTGPGGGVGVVDGWRSPVSGMTGPEVQALVVGEAGARDLGLGADFATARLKMLTATAAQGDAVRAAHSAPERFLLDNEQWFSSGARPVALQAVAEAVWSSRRITVRYARGGIDAEPGAPRRRLLDPLGLVLKTDRWYLVAAHRRQPRTYRVSRIVGAVKMHEEPARRPPGFSLAEYWERSSTRFEASVHTVPVHLSVPRDSVAALLASVPGEATRQAVDAARTAQAQNGRLHLELLMERIDIAASQLMGVPGVEVHDPAPLRSEIRARAGEIAARNG